MKQHNQNQQRHQFRTWLKQFWADWKPTLAEVGGAVIVAAVGTLAGFAAYYYTMAWALWACILCTLAAVVLGTSLTVVFTTRLVKWAEGLKNKKDKDRLITGVSIANPTAAPATP